MSRYNKETERAIGRLQAMASLGTLERETKENFVREIESLRHAIEIDSRKEVQAAVGRLARLFVKAS